MKVRNSLVIFGLLFLIFFQIPAVSRPGNWLETPAKKALAEIVVFDKFDSPYVKHQAD